MSRVSELIDLIVQGKNAEASDVLNSELLARSYAGINEIKPEVATNYFSPVVGEPQEDEPGEPQEEITNTEEDE
ncbi:MAG: hypothetical protein VW878_06590 [Candidatus Poseidoniales archaeon]|jgi:hypothetical protein